MLDGTKPHRGEIEGWRREGAPIGERFRVVGYLNHEMRHPFQTGSVVAYEHPEIETLVNRYTLVGEETKPHA